jgi:putative transcriptional regulator
VIRFKLAEQLEKKPIHDSRRIAMQEVSDATGINRSTPPKILNHKGYGTGTDVPDRLCSWRECRREDLAEHIADQSDASSFALACGGRMDAHLTRRASQRRPPDAARRQQQGTRRHGDEQEAPGFRCREMADPGARHTQARQHRRAEAAARGQQRRRRTGEQGPPLATRMPAGRRGRGCA